MLKHSWYLILFIITLFITSCKDDEIINPIIVRDEVHGTFSIKTWLCLPLMSGAIDGRPTLIEEYIDSIKIQLLKDGEVFQETYSDSNKFVFKQIPYGTYDIKFILNDEIYYLEPNVEIEADIIPDLKIEGVFPPYSNILSIDSDYQLRLTFGLYDDISPDTARFRTSINVHSDNVDVNLQIMDMQGNVLQNETFPQRHTGWNSLVTSFPKQWKYKMLLLYASYFVDNNKYFAYTTFVNGIEE